MSFSADAVNTDSTLDIDVISTNHSPDALYGGAPSLPARANATFVFLCRNKDLPGVVSSMQAMEDRFNRKYNYPWVLLNEEPFTEEFKQCVDW